MQLVSTSKALNRQPGMAGAMVLGATAAIVASNLMTVFRMGARRFGYIEKTVPQAVQDWALEKSGMRVPEPLVTQHVVDQVLHMGYATGLGALDAFLYEKNFKHTYLRGALIGAASWAFAGYFLLPALGVSKSAKNATTRENVVNLTAHLIFGLSTSLVTEEFIHQPERGPANKVERQLAEVG